MYKQLTLFGEEEELCEEITNKKPYKIEITEVKDLNGDGAVDLQDIELLLKSVDGKPELLKGDGDFRSDECVELLKQADVVVTNPPFSLFREYVAQLIEYNKKFVIIGNKNAITYKEIFPLLKKNKMWIGYKAMGGSLWFTTPDGFGKKSDKIVDGIKLTEVPCCWYTNLDIQKRHENLILYRNYNSEEYPTYDNYNAIEVSKVSEIPEDYYGVMGVPIRVSYGVGIMLSKEEVTARFQEHKGFRRGKLCYRDKNGKLQMCYRRILIRRKRGIV